MDAHNFLFCSLDAALITDLAWQVHREGHGVKYYVEAESDREIGDGFVPKTSARRSGRTRRRHRRVQQGRVPLRGQ